MISDCSIILEINDDLINIKHFRTTLISDLQFLVDINIIDFTLPHMTDVVLLSKITMVPEYDLFDS